MTIALGMALKGPVEPDVFVAWLRVLRDRAWPGPVYVHRDVYPCQARNEITKQFLDGPADSLFMFDSDQVPPLLCLRTEAGQVANLTQLLDEHTEPIVCGLVYRRQRPYEPVVYTFDRKGKREYLTPGRIATILKTRRVVEIESYGSGTLLIQRKVLQQLVHKKGREHVWEADPAFDGDEGWKFCSEVRELGYRLWLDPRIEAAHVAAVPISSTDYMREHGYQLSD